jgi:hypothetical protein
MKTRDMKNRIHEAVTECVGEMADKLSEAVAAIVEESLLGLVRDDATPTTSKKKRGGPSGAKSAEAMRCRHIANGKQCRNRSKGPRFRYLCEEHLGGAKKPAVKKPEVKKAEVPKAEVPKVEKPETKKE